MKKRRILACALSLSMVVSSFTYGTYAQEDVIVDTEATAVSDADDVTSPASASSSNDAVSPEDTSVQTAETMAITESEWDSGSTGSNNTASVQKIEVSDGGTSAHLYVGNGKGKLSAGEDAFVYYGTKVENGMDFELSATVKVNALGAATGTTSSRNQQGYGLAVVNDLYDRGGVENSLTTKKGDSNFTASGAFGGYLQSKDADATAKIGLRTREGKDGKETVRGADQVEQLAKASITGDETFEMKLVKAGNVIQFTCNGATDSYTFNESDMTGANGNYIYPLVYVARGADVEFTNISFTKDEKKVTGIEITKEPDKTDYFLNQDLDTAGMKVKATYDDGTSEFVDNYLVSGYDKTAVGTQTLTVSRGTATATFDVTVNPVSLSKLTVTTSPYNTTYHGNTPFEAKGLVVKADYADDTSAEFKDGEGVKLSVNGTPLVDGELLDPSILAANGEVEVKVEHGEDPNYSISDDIYTTFKMNVSNSTLNRLNVAFQPAKTTYYIGDEFDPTGLSLTGVYTDGYDEVVKDDEYTLSGFDSETAGTKTITVTSTVNPDVSTTFEVTVLEKIAINAVVTNYPKTTYTVGEAWDPEGLEVSYLYNSTEYIPIELGKDYTIDSSSFNSSSAGTTYVTIIPTDTKFSPIQLDISIRDKSEVYWKSLVFGQSSTGVSAGNAKSSVTDNGNGTYTIRSWDGSGKITGDHDGIAYYYTRVNPDDNFSLSADVYVRGYLGTHPGTTPGNYNVDAARSGQEAFGLMARDVIPLDAKEGFGNDNDITVDSAEAEVDENGEPVGKRSADVFASNIAIAGGYSGTSWPQDKTAASYEKNANINRINLYTRYGVTEFDNRTGGGGGTKLGPKAVSTAFPLAGIHDENTNTKRMGDVSDETQVGDSYRITLERVNVLADPVTGAITRRGLKATCQYLGPDEERAARETPMVTYMSDEEVNDLFSVQNDHDAYVGFFSARWGIIDVSNIDFKVTDPATDQVYSVVEEPEVVPAANVTSALYTSDVDYTLMVRSSNANGGYLTIKKGDEVIQHNLIIGKKRTRIPLTLDENAANTYTLIYTPSTLDKLTTYSDVVSTVTIHHRSETTGDIIYVAPNGQSEAYEDASGVLHTAGSEREYPMDLPSALEFVKPGQKVVMLDGTYVLNEKLTVGLDNCGSKGNVKTLEADEGAHPVIDFNSTGTGFYVGGNYWYMKDFEVIHSADQQPGFELGGKNCTIENVKTHDNGGTGFQVSRISAEQEYIQDWPSNNIIRHCETWNNQDSTKINADGFGHKLTCGYGNVFDNCVSHHNVDDGWDMYTKLASGPIGPATLVNCAAYKMGWKLVDGKDESYEGGGHNGYKMGGENIFDQHYIKDSISFMNGASGVTSNSNPALKIRNSVFYKNSGAGMSLSSSAPSLYNYDVKGAVSVNNSGRDSIGGSLNQDTSFTNHSETDPLAESSDNYFTKTSGEGAVNALGNAFDPDTMFVSTNYSAAAPGGRFEQLEDGSYDFKGFLQKKTPYEYDEDSTEDVVLMFGCFEEDGSGYYIDENDPYFKSGKTKVKLDSNEYEVDEDYLNDTDVIRLVKKTASENEETTEATTSQTTTKKSSSGGGSSSSGGSRRSSSNGSGSSKASGTTAPSATVTPGTKAAVPNENAGSTDSNSKSANPTNGTNATTGNDALGNVGGFTDVSSRPWAADAIASLSKAGIINGTSAGIFDPDAPAKRCDFVVMLMKVMGAEGTATDNFDDVPADAYYANAVGLAKEMGIAEGMGDGTFAPTATITRQDMMVLVARALEVSGVELDKDTSVLSKFADSDSIADYAKPYVAALVSAQIVNGTGNNVEPVANITRAQMAVLLYNVYSQSSDAQ